MPAFAHTDEFGIEFREQVFGDKNTINEGLTIDPPEIDGQLNLQLVPLCSEFTRATWTKAPVPMNEDAIYKIALATKVAADNSAFVLQTFSEPKCSSGHGDLTSSWPTRLCVGVKRHVMQGIVKECCLDHLHTIS